MLARTMLVCVATAQLAASAAAADLRSLFDRSGNPIGSPVEIRQALKEWVFAVVAQHGYSPGAPTVASKLNTELQALMPTGPLCRSGPRAGCLGTLHVVDLARPYLVAVTASVANGCGYEELAYVFEWTRSRWYLRVALEHTLLENGRTRAWRAFSVSDGPEAGRVLAAVAVSGECGVKNPRHAEFWVYRFSDTRHRLLLSELRSGVSDSGLSVVALPDEVRFEFSVRSLDPRVHLRPAVHTYDLRTADSPARTQPIASSLESFVEEWLTRPWSEARHWSAGEPRLAKAHASMHGPASRGEFLPPVDCASPQVFEVPIRRFEVLAGENVKLVPVAYFKVESLGADRFRMLDAAAEPDADCPRWTETQ